MKKLLSTLRIGMALFMAMFGTNLLPVFATQTAYAASNANNAGDTKIIDDLGDANEIPNNDPQLTDCDLTMEFYNFDNDTATNATVEFTPKAPTADVTISVTGDTTPTLEGDGDADGQGNNDFDGRETYTLSFTGDPKTDGSKQGYHVDIDVKVDGTTGGKKNKVVWMPASCGTPTTTDQTNVSPQLPTYDDRCSTKNDSIIPPQDSDQITYSLNGNVVTATLVNPNTHDFGALLNGYIVAVDGLTATYVVTHQFTNEPCVDVCPVELGTNLSTNLNKNGWTVPAEAEYVDGGIKLKVSGAWDSTSITRNFSGTLADLGSVVDIDASPLQYVGIHVVTSAGVLTYEEEPTYGGNWWSWSDFNVASGMGYPTFDSLENIAEANPDLAVTSVYVLYTHPNVSSSTVASVTFGCVKYTFDKVEDRKTDVEATEPTFLEPTCDFKQGRLIIPTKQGVVYKVDGAVTATGTYNFTPGVDVTVTAEALNATYNLTGDDEWQHTFAAAPTSCVLGDTDTKDLCPNLPGGPHTTMPAGYTQVDGQCVLPGGQGQVLGTTLPTTIPATGSTSLPNPLLSIVAGFFTYLFLRSKNRKAEA